jgi:hypothetical protein
MGRSGENASEALLSKIAPKPWESLPSCTIVRGGDVSHVLLAHVRIRPSLLT